MAAVTAALQLAKGQAKQFAALCRPRYNPSWHFIHSSAKVVHASGCGSSVLLATLLLMLAPDTLECKSHPSGCGNCDISIPLAILLHMLAPDTLEYNSHPSFR